MKNFEDVGVQVPDIRLPKTGTDLTKWAVIACDQFTSQSEYWQQVEEITRNAPSTYHMILPEVYLGTPREEIHSAAARQAMRTYLDDGLLTSQEGMVLVERSVNGKRRLGLVLALDLESYDYRPGSQSMIRATEGTILERLPPRIKIREGAPLELPHILVLIDDPAKTVIEPLAAHSNQLTPLYDFELMLGSGHLRGHLVNQQTDLNQVVSALRALADPQSFAAKYGLTAEKGVLLFAMGDGNHSLATAKAIWEKIKTQVAADHPARWALVEIENVHDEGLAFEPIHRVLFQVNDRLLERLSEHFGADAQVLEAVSAQHMQQMVLDADGQQRVGFIGAGMHRVITFTRPSSNLAVGTIQPFLDRCLKEGVAAKIDYVHGDEVVFELGGQKGNVGFYLPPMAKEDLFKTVILDGVLPRKTFSMGEAIEKRFYMEARRIN